MRTSLIISAIAASVLTVGFAASAVQAGGGESAAPPPTVPGMDFLADLGLTPEQTQCLVDAAGELDTSDMTAVMSLMTDCGIDPMELVTGGATEPEPVAEVETTFTVDDTTAIDTAIDPAVAASVLLMLGVDPTAAQCIEEGLQAAVSPGDDNEALSILQQCGLTLNDLLIGLVALDDLAAGTGDVSTPAVSEVTPAVSEVPTSDGEIVSSGNELVDQIQQIVLDQYGVELSDDQVNCLLDNDIAALDPNDMAGALALMESCGISLADLAG